MPFYRHPNRNIYYTHQYMTVLNIVASTPVSQTTKINVAQDEVKIYRNLTEKSSN